MEDIPEEILKACIKGEKRGQEKLYQLFSSRMYVLCLRYMGNEDDASDVMQDGFIKVFKKISQYSGKGSLEGWIRRIMVNTALEKFRSKPNVVYLDDSYNTLEGSGNDDAIQQLNTEDILKLIQELSPAYRMVFNLFAIEGYSHMEIAGRLGISEGTSKSNLSRARIILQGKIKEIFTIPPDCNEADK